MKSTKVYTIPGVYELVFDGNEASMWARADKDANASRLNVLPSDIRKYNNMDEIITKGLPVDPSCKKEMIIYKKRYFLFIMNYIFLVYNFPKMINYLLATYKTVKRRNATDNIDDFRNFCQWWPIINHKIMATVKKMRKLRMSCGDPAHRLEILALIHKIETKFRLTKRDIRRLNQIHKMESKLI